MLVLERVCFRLLVGGPGRLKNQLATIKSMHFSREVLVVTFTHLKLFLMWIPLRKTPQIFLLPSVKLR